MYEKCEDRIVALGSYCKKYMSLNTNKDDFNYTKKCTQGIYSSPIKYKTIKIKWTEYSKANIPIQEYLCS